MIELEVYRSLTHTISGFDNIVVCICAGERKKKKKFHRKWTKSFRKYVKKLDKDKPVIIAGDMKVCRSPLDMKVVWRANLTAGYTDWERNAMDKLLDAGFVDTYREFHPKRAAVYTYWSYAKSARSRNIGR